MQEEAFERYLTETIAGYAEQNVASGRWLPESALSNAKAEFQILLPQGLQTANNHLFEILEIVGGQKVGYLWFAMQEKYGSKGAFVYDLKISEKHRRKGHAKRAFLQLESIARNLKLSSISLHVFWHNQGAQALYREIGYSETGINMRKTIEQNDA